MAGIGIDNQFALSLQATNDIRNVAKTDQRAGLKKAAQQFEAIFLQRMLKQMRAAIPKSDLMHSQQTDLYNDLMDKQWSQTLAQRGMGLADMLTQELGKDLPKSSSSKTQEPLFADRTDDQPALFDMQKDSQPLLARQQAKPTGYYASQLGVLPKRMAQFLNKLAPQAQKVSQKTGLPQQLILAQAALETGWGDHEITDANGQQSFNVFNIKASSGHRSIKALTTEYANGQVLKENVQFRRYGSYEQAFDDYTRLMQSPRYASVIHANSAQQAARQLQASGYATDPDYAAKLISIMQTIQAGQAQKPAQPLYNLDSSAQGF